MYYLKSIDETIKELKTSREGLGEKEALSRLERNGKNKLAQGKKESKLHMFLRQLADPMIIILIVAAVISGIVSAMQNESFTDVIIIGAVVIVNAVLGVYQEGKAEEAIEALSKMSAATSKVIRGGNIKVIKSEDIVVGDIIIIEAGDSIPADARIIESASFKVEESALTGESVPSEKSEKILRAENGEDVPLGDRSNMIYMGSVCVYGRGRAVVTETGMDTEMGKIADAISKAEDGKTPLQIKLAELSKILTYLVIGISVLVFIVNIIRNGGIIGDIQSGNFKPIIDTLMVAISLAVAAIPEGLATVVTLVLSMGVTKMSKRNAIIRRLTAVETLGCTEIICSDKTGTLTQNKMTVVKEYTNDGNLMAVAMSLCCDSRLNADGIAEGEPTENALVNYAKSKNIDKNEYEKDHPRVGEAPFDSMRKMMSTVHDFEDRYFQFTKGAPDEVLKRCKYIQKDGRQIELDDEERRAIIEENTAMTSEALRVLACAYKTYEKLPDDFTSAKIEKDLVFIGLYGMIDPVRPEVLPAIEQCRAAGIRPVMITGDHIGTARAIAKELGIIDNPDSAISGSDLDRISDEDFAQSVEKYSVYARVRPEHKVRIVNAWRSKGKITAMTGDGVNDAPSIKAADIGVGMGITGTDVTKNVADMVLADDNFATIVSAVEEGRKIYDNIRKSIQFLLSSNLSEVVSVFLATLFGFTILKPVHLLWINLITDTFPALSLGVEEGEGDIMKRPPRNSGDGIFSGGVGYRILYQGIIISVLTLLSYFAGVLFSTGNISFTTSTTGMTMAFITLSFAEAFHSFNMRSFEKSIFEIGNKNKFLIISAILSFAITTAVVMIPGLNNIFGFSEITPLQYLTAIAIAFVIIPVVEIEKFIGRARARR